MRKLFAPGAETTNFQLTVERKKNAWFFSCEILTGLLILFFLLSVFFRLSFFLPFFFFFFRLFLLLVLFFFFFLGGGGGLVGVGWGAFEI